MHACTIIAKNYISYARVLSDSFFRTHPGGTFAVLIVDDYQGYIDPEEESFEVIDIKDIGVDNLQEMLRCYDLIELTTAVKPWLLRSLLDRGYEEIIYFDPDIEILQNLDDIGKSARLHGIVLIPHTTDPMPRDDRRPTETNILTRGMFNLGFIGLGAGEQTDAFLEWWKERLKEDCRVEPEDGYFVDQKWIDFVPSIFPSYEILRDPGCNVAYWNLITRDFSKDGTGYTVNGQPLGFFHFSGFDPEKPHLLSTFQDRILLSESPALNEICKEYAGKVLAHGYKATRKWPFQYSTLPNGVDIDSYAKLIIRKAEKEGQDFGDVFTEQGSKGLMDWLNGRAPYGAGNGVTRYLYEVYVKRPDLQLSYPNLDGPEGKDFLQWVDTHGRSEVPIHPKLLPFAQNNKAEQINASNTESVRDEKISGVNVAGYFNAELGVGQAGRALVQALESQEIPVSLRTIALTQSRQEQEFKPSNVTNSGDFPIGIVCANADQLPHIKNSMGAQLFENQYTIGLWFWEVSEFPEAWIGSFDLVDEVWVASSHTADAIARLSSKPVVKIKLPITASTENLVSRRELGLPDKFMYLFVFDFFSIVDRKNPFGLVEAFKRAFKPGEGPILIIKTINGDKVIDAYERFMQEIAERPDIVVIKDYLTSQELSSLMATCDCYVSLHRGEGLGLTMGEAMYLGKPVISTAYAGNLEFMTSMNSYLVDYKMTKIPKGCEPYPEGAEWAEPDVGHAAHLMRDVFENQNEARRRGERASKEIRRDYSEEATGKEIVARLQHIQRSLNRPKLGLQVTGSALTELGTMIDVGPDRRRRSRFGRLGTWARNLLLKLLTPYRNHQKGIDSRILDRLVICDSSIQQTQKKVELAASIEDTRNLGKNLNSVNKFVDEASSRIEEMDEISKQLYYESRWLPSMSGVDDFLVRKSDGTEALGYEGGEAQPKSADVYIDFEDIFRGSEEEIAESQEVYLSIVSQVGNVLDIGCGRGEFLELLKANDIEAIGVEPDEGMVERCRQRGLTNVDMQDANTYLKAQEDSSQSVIFSAQVIEHFEYEYLIEYFKLAVEILKSGGMFIAETVNPHCPQALKAFWLDLTHEQPIYPEVALQLCKQAGFVQAEILFPNGSGVLDEDRFTQSAYAVIARKA